MTLNEITTIIAGRFGKELDMQYRQWLVPQINAWRSRLIRNTLQKNPQDKSRFMQTIQIPLTYGDYTCDVLDCQGSVSDELPEVVRIGDTPFEYLGGADLKSPYRFDDVGTSPWIGRGMTAHMFHTYLLDNNRIIIPGERIGKVVATAIFDQPDQAMQWQCNKAGIGCDWWNAPYPISGDIQTDLTIALQNGLGQPKEILPAKTDQDE
jgi:hypothetical protein